MFYGNYGKDTWNTCIVALRKAILRIVVVLKHFFDHKTISSPFLYNGGVGVFEVF